MFPTRLKQLRSEKRLLQQDVAKYLGVTTSAYGFYEQGNRKPDINTVLQLADFFDVSLDYLLGRTAERKPFTLEGPKDINEFLCSNEIQFDGQPVTDEEKESIKEFIRLWFKTMRENKGKK